jgi:putative selenium metabolism protein SsnA
MNATTNPTVTVFRNATVLEFDPPRIREGMNVVVRGGEIAEVGPRAGATAEEAPRGGKGSGTGRETQQNARSTRIIDLKGKLLFPGLVNSHTHYYSALARGVMADLNPMPDFVSILRQLWWRLDQAIDLEILYYSGLTASLDAIRCGTTAAIDHNASANAIEGSLVALKRGFEKAGLRGATCYEVTDRYGDKGMHDGIDENVAFAELVDSERQELRERGDGRDVLVESHIGGHAPCTIPDEALARLADACEKTERGFHVHVAEDRWDVSHSHITYAEDLIPRLDRFGLVNDRSMLIHGVFLNRGEVELINSRNAFMVHNCRSNMNNGVGYNHLLPEIGNLALGTDGIGGNMFSSMQTAFFKHRDAQGPVQADFFLKALAAGNRLLERIFHRPFGRVEPGYPADLVVAEYSPPTPLLPENIAGHMAFGMGSEIVESVMIAGKMVMEERRFPQDIEGIYGEARGQARRLWERMNGVTP